MATRYAVVELDSAESTQDEARERYERSRPTLVIAGHQTSGRGRLGREWVEPDSAMFASLAFEPTWPTGTWGLIPLVAGLAVRSAITAFGGIVAGLRWPNDLMLTDGKVGGLLSESSGGVVVVGCGVNLRWDTPIEGAAALYGAESGATAAKDLATAWVDRFLERMESGPNAWGIDEYRNACVTIGSPVSYPGGSGIARDVSDDGLLMVETSRGVVAVHAGDVRSLDRATLPTDRRD